MNLSKSITTFVLALIMLMSVQSVTAKTYILCMGISDYPGRQNDLTLPVRDAKIIKWLYEQNGDCETILLTNKNVTCGNVLKTMQKLFAKATPEDAVAIYYSGHGSEKGAIYLYDGELTYERIYKVFDGSKAKRRFAFINACYSGTMRQNFTGEGFKGKNVMFFLSSRSTETTLEFTYMKNSIFTAFLQQGLRGSADADKNRVITARELFDYVSVGVAEHTENAQHPVMWGSFANDMPIMTWKSKK